MLDTMRARSLLPILALGLALMLVGPVEARDHRDHDSDRRAGARVEVSDFALRNGQADGSHVAFRYNETGLHGVTAHGVKLFDLTTDKPVPRGGIEVDDEGAKIELKSRTFKARVHDNPTAATQVKAPGAQLTLALAEPARVVLDADGARFTIGPLHGMVRGEDLRVSGQNVTSSDEMLVMLQVPRADVDKHRADIARAIIKRHVGAEASFALGNGQLKKEVVPYGDVNVTTVKAERGNLTVLIEGHGTEGRVVVLNVDGDVLGALKKEDLSVFLDNESVRTADDLEDALDPANDGFHPESYVVFDPQAGSFQLLLTVPHYSVHTLTVNVVELLRPSVVIGVVGGVLVLLPMGFALFRRK